MPADSVTSKLRLNRLKSPGLGIVGRNYRNPVKTLDPQAVRIKGTDAGPGPSTNSMKLVTALWPGLALVSSTKKLSWYLSNRKQRIVCGVALGVSIGSGAEWLTNGNQRERMCNAQNGKTWARAIMVDRSIDLGDRSVSYLP